MKMHSILAFVLTIQSAFATSFYIRPFSEFTKGTPNIIRGVVHNIHVENGVTPDDGKTIYTFASLEIKEVIKGNISGTQIQIRKLGGTKDGVTLEIPSSVEFTEKEEGVYFLSDPLDDHSYEVSSLELGKFNLVEKNGEQILKGGLFAYSHPEPPGHQHDVHADDLSENLKPWSIHQLKELVKKQEAEMAPSPDSNKNQLISNTYTKTQLETLPPPSLASESKNMVSEEKENSALYFGPTVWYSLAIIILTLGAIWWFRRG